MIEILLTDLEPRWIHPNVFVFRCPCCLKVLLSCKDVAMREQEQFDLFEREFGERWNELVVPASADFCWGIAGTRPVDLSAAFTANLTVTPSIDASASGHWHGWITDGRIR